MGADGWPLAYHMEFAGEFLFISLWELSNIQAVDDLGPGLADLEARITGVIKPTRILIYLVGIC